MAGGAGAMTGDAKLRASSKSRIYAIFPRTKS